MARARTRAATCRRSSAPSCSTPRRAMTIRRQVRTSPLADAAHRRPCPALNIDPGPARRWTACFSAMNERILASPTVFGHYSPLFHIRRRARCSGRSSRSTRPATRSIAPISVLFPDQPFGIDQRGAAAVRAVGERRRPSSTPSTTRCSTAECCRPHAPPSSARSRPARNNGRAQAALYLTFTSGEYLVQH